MDIVEIGLALAAWVIAGVAFAAGFFAIGSRFEHAFADVYDAEPSAKRSSARRGGSE